MAQLQNIPSRKKPEKYDPRVQNLGPKIRSMFIESPPDEESPEGYSLIDSDLSQLELRLGAHFTQDYTLLKIYREARNLDEFTFYVGDVHAETSVKMGVPRKLAKNLNFGLCLVGSTWVLTPYGYRQISTVRVGDYVLTHKGRFRRVTAIQQLEASQIITVETSSGKVIEGTPDHMMLRYFPAANGQRGGQGWVPLIDLQKGDYLCYHETGYDGLIHADLDECRLVGWFISEGSVDNYRIKVAQSPTANPDVTAKMSETLEKMGFAWHDLHGSSPHLSAPAAVWRPILKRFGLDAALKSGDKRIPEAIFQLTRTARLEILGALWDGDGSICCTRGRGQMTYASKSRALLKDVARLLDSVGINAKVYSYPSLPTNGVSIVGSKSKLKFMATVPTVKVNRAAYRPNKQFDAEEKIVSISSRMVPETVYDLTVDEDHSFTANGLFTHNCYGMGADRFAVYADLFIPGTLEYDLTASAKYVGDFQGVYHGVFSYHRKLRDRWHEGQRAFVLLDGSYRHFPRYPNVSGGTIYNSKIQGSAARVMNAHIWALGKYVLPNPEFKGLRLLMQVHDEVLAEAPKSIAQKCAVMIKYIQEYPWYNTEVPLLASTKVVQSWDQKDNDDIPELGTFYAEIEGRPTLFKPKQWAEYRALEKQKKVGVKGCVAMLTNEQKAWARSMLPEHLPTFSREEGGVRVMSLEAYKALKAQRKKEEDGGSDD